MGEEMDFSFFFQKRRRDTSTMEPGLSSLNRLRTSPALSEVRTLASQGPFLFKFNWPSPIRHGRMGGTTRSSKQARELEARRRRERPRRGRRAHSSSVGARARGVWVPPPPRRRGVGSGRLGLRVAFPSAPSPSNLSCIRASDKWLLTLISIRDERQCECTSPWFTSSIRCVFFV